MVVSLVFTAAPTQAISFCNIIAGVHFTFPFFVLALTKHPEASPPVVTATHCPALLQVVPVLGWVTVICSEPVTPEPSVAVAITVTVPAPVAVNKPDEELIVAEPVPFVTDHVTTGLVALDGDIIVFI
jgi:hypothetical protein